MTAIIITIPKKHKLLESLFRKSHTKDLVFHSNSQALSRINFYWVALRVVGWPSGRFGRRVTDGA